MGESNLEQQIKIKFYMQISEREMLALLKMAYGGHAMKKLIIFEWCRCFKKGQEDVHNTRSGLPKNQRTDANLDNTNLSALRSKIKCATDTRNCQFACLFGST